MLSTCLTDAPDLTPFLMLDEVDPDEPTCVDVRWIGRANAEEAETERVDAALLEALDASEWLDAPTRVGVVGQAEPTVVLVWTPPASAPVIAPVVAPTRPSLWRALLDRAWAALMALDALLASALDLGPSQLPTAR